MKYRKISVIFLLIMSYVILSSNESHGIELSKMEPTMIEEAKFVKNQVKIPNTDSYSTNVMRLIASQNGRASYNLSSKYVRFGGTLMVASDTHNGALLNVDIIGDGNLLFSATDMVKNGNPVPFQIDVQGINSLVIRSYNQERYPFGAVYLYEPYLMHGGVASNDVSNDITIKFADMNVIEKKGNIDILDHVYDVQRVRYDKDIVEYDATRGSSIKMELRKMYSRFTGKVLISKDTGWKADMNVQFIGDGKRLLEVAHLKSSEFNKDGRTSYDFDIDLSGVNIFEIKTVNNGDKYRGFLYFVNSVFKLLPHDHYQGRWGFRVRPTCYMTGSAFQYCELCNSNSDSTSLPADGHTAGSESKIIKEPTCEEPGISAKYCSICGDIAEETHLPAIGHDFTEWQHDSGSLLNGPIIEKRECRNCQQIETRESNPGAVIVPMIVVLGIAGCVAFLIIRRRKNKP